MSLFAKIRLSKAAAAAEIIAADSAVFATAAAAGTGAAATGAATVSGFVVDITTDQTFKR